MKALFATLTLCALVNSIFAQYDNPESVEYDPSFDRYLVSNTGSGQILALDQMGVTTLFASLTGTGPHGLEILGNVVYACNGGSVKGFDLTTGTQVFNLNLGGAFLNGITTDGTFLYVTDFNAARIYKVDVAGQTFSTLVNNTNGTPNGIVYDPDFGLGMLFVAFWGPNAPVKTYDPNTGVAGPTISTNLTNIDGITLDCLGNLYLASWSPDAITMVDVNNGTQTNMGWAVTNPADIDYDPVNFKICIPNTSTNSVSLELVGNCVTDVAASTPEPSITVHPVPATDALTLRGDLDRTISVEILDLFGRPVRQAQLLDDNVVNIEDLPAGHYLLVLNGKGERIRFVKR